MSRNPEWTPLGRVVAGVSFSALLQSHPGKSYTSKILLPRTSTAGIMAMRGLSLAVIAAHCVTAALLLGDDVAQFKSWLGTHGHRYQGEDPAALYEAWRANKKIVDAVNSEQRGWVAELGPFAGYTQQQFAERVLMPQRKVVKEGKTLKPSADVGEGA